MKEVKSTKSRILEVALRLFGKQGYYETSIQQIADEVGITQPAVFIHFKNKMLLFEALRSWVAEDNRRYVDGQISIYDSAMESLSMHIFLNIKWALENPEKFQIILLLYYFSCSNSKMKELNQAALESGEVRILKYILAASREGSIETKKTKALSEQLHAFTIGYAIKVFNSNEPIVLSTLRKVIKEYILKVSDHH